MNTPLITIGITCYREGQFLRECWESVLAQTDSRWEAVMVLDGGADKKTRKIFEEIKHERLRKFCNKNNQGPYPTRNLAIEQANTGWFFQVDADDRLPKNAIAVILEAISNDLNADFVFGDCLYFGRQAIRTLQIERFDADKLVQGLLTVITGASPFRISAYKDVGGFATALSHGGADWDFWIGMAEKEKKGVRAANTIYERRERPHSVSSGWQTRRADVAKVIIERHPEFFAVTNRKQECLYHAYLKMAQALRKKGERAKAADAAWKALELGGSKPQLEEIIRESEMPFWRYKSRIIFRWMGDLKNGARSTK